MCLAAKRVGEVALASAAAPSLAQSGHLRLSSDVRLRGQSGHSPQWLSHTFNVGPQAEAHRDTAWATQVS